MLSLRKMVAGPKIRTKENGFDLDLTYVTDRVIAMAFPAEGLEKLYRNSINDVSQYLTQKHSGYYMLYNLSGRKYDYEKFNNRVKEFDWQDHQAPTLFTVFQICQQMKLYLQQKQQNIVVVHCNHGKGRTGTIIVCLLLFCNYFDNPEEALQFYAKKRFQKEGYGVTQPCQVRYINYFYQLLINKSIKIRAYSLKSIQFKGKCKIQNCQVVVSNVRTKKKIIKTQPIKNKIIDIKQKNLLLGDIFLDFKIPGILNIGQKQFARLNLNTIFMPQNLTISLSASNISPDNLESKYKNLIGSNFSMQITFEQYCDCNLIIANQQNKCPCLQQIKQQRVYWQSLYKILKQYTVPSKTQSFNLLFYDNQNQRLKKPRNQKHHSVQKTSHHQNKKTRQQFAKSAY